METERFDINTCRICLTNKKQLCPMFKYKATGNYAEMLTAIADVKVAANDGLPDKICTKCCAILEKAYLLKTVAERSDRKLRKLLSKGRLSVPTKKIAFDSFVDIKSEIPFSVKPEPKWELDMDVSNTATETVGIDDQGLVIANTLIRKVDANAEDNKVQDLTDNMDLTWTKMTAEVRGGDSDGDYVDAALQDDDNDADYTPTAVKVKKVKRIKEEPRSNQIPDKIVRRIKVLRTIKNETDSEGNVEPRKRGERKTTITCYPIMKNGTRGAPILLKRPKDATVLKVPGSLKRLSDGTIKRERSVKIMRAAQPKQKEKMVCPICGILTYTLGNHIATHEEKKKYTCNQCPKTFSQRSNLLIHAKQHTGIKDHICEVCGAGFYSQKSLVRHNLIHKGERPFPCGLCNKRFIAVCNVAFSYKVNLNNHVFKVHGVNLKFKSIHVVTEDVLRREMGVGSETTAAIAHILPHLGDVPAPAAHETVTHDYIAG